ncbi:hypothetical protein BH09PSE4_BH09PSE4_10120 [soil metagenome]
MRDVLSSDFLWRIVGGFVVGAIGAVMMVPAGAATLVEHLSHIAH